MCQAEIFHHIIILKKLFQESLKGIFLTSGIPDPQAYGANTLTRQTARKAKDNAQ